MSEKRPFVLTIAGLDPSAGAGILADIKTFEQHRVYGLAINTGNTIQTEDCFHRMEWVSIEFVIDAIKVLFLKYEIVTLKIGIVPSLSYLKEVVLAIRNYSATIPIVWDPILKSTTEFDFLAISNRAILVEVLQNINLITPNYNEIKFFNLEEPDVEIIANSLSNYCPVLLKGGHNSDEIGVDYLYTNHEVLRLLPKQILGFEKHGSGCVLSAAIVANLAFGESLAVACEKAKLYIENYLETNSFKLGYHYVS